VALSMPKCISGTYPPEINAKARTAWAFEWKSIELTRALEASHI